MRYTIENEFIRLTIDSLGAEMVSAVDRATGSEMIWCADPAVWNRHAPILFPYAGKLTGGHFKAADGKLYEGKQHGFARDMEHTLLIQTGHELTFELASSDKTRAIWPYDFALRTTFTLEGRHVRHTVSVRNAEPKTEDAAAETAAVPADGSYTCAVTLEGGSGRATVESPAALTVADGTMTAVIVWSSPNYDYMLIDGEKYLPTNTEGNSTFEIPVAALDTALAVTADTVAMSTPHEIDYTLTFDSATLTPAE